MWHLQTSLLEPVEPTQILQMRVAGKRTLTQALQRRAAPGAASAPDAAPPAASGSAEAGASGPGADPFWFAGGGGGGGATASDRLPSHVQQQMEQSFGADFSDVRIGVGGEATERGALAFARGNELQFAPGQYDPTSPAGLELIGHELAHVVQQRQGRASSAQAKADGGGVVVVDASLEAEADAAGARAARGLPAGLGASSGTASSGDGAIQRKATAVGVVDRGADASVTMQLLRSLVTQHAIEHLFESIERVMLWWADAKVQNLAKSILDRVLSASIKEAVEAFAAVVTPYLSVLGQVRSYYRALPEVVQNLMIFGIGSGMARLLAYIAGPSTVDWITNGIFLDGGSFITKIEWVTKQLSDICTAPFSWAYNMVWSKIRGKLGSTAGTPAVGAAGAAYEHVMGPDPSAPSAAPPQRAPAQEQAPAQAEPEDESAKAAKAAEKAAALKKDLKYFWLDVDPPKLERFDHDKRKSGGLVLPFQFGMNLFGTKLKPTGAKQELHIPWGGGFAVDLKDIQIETPLRFEPIFSVGTIKLIQVKVTEKGLEALDLAVDQMTFADGAVTLSKLSAKYIKNSGLALGGAATVKVHDQEPITTTGALKLDANGDFEAGSLEVATPASFTIIDPLLVMKSPKLSGSIDKSHNIALSLKSGITSKFSFVDIDAKGAHLDYKKGKGHELAGGVDDLTVKLGEHVTLSGKDIELSRKGLYAKELGLEYKHNPNEPARATHELSTIGGVPPELLSFTGLTSLVIGGKVLGLRIGPPPKPVAAEGSQLAVPAPSGPAQSGSQAQASSQAQAQAQAQAPASKLGSAESNFHADSVEPKISKIGANAFGMHAELDFDKPEITMGGKVSYKPDLPEASFEAHLLPGLAVFGSVAPSVSLSAEASGKGGVPRKDAFALTGKVTGSAELGIMAKLGAQVGTSLIAALRAGVFAEGKLKVTAEATASGVVVLDRQSRTLRISDVPAEKPRIHYAADANVSASIGVVVSGHAFFFFSKELYRYTFKDWQFGLYHAEGDIDFDGKPSLDDKKSGFVKEDKTKADPPGMTKEQIDIEEARAFLMSARAIGGSAEKRKELLAEVREKYKKADTTTMEALDQAIKDERTFQTHFEQYQEQVKARSPQEADAEADAFELSIWERKLREHSAAVVAAQKSHRELQLVLVKGDGLTDQLLEEGGLDLGKLEQSIRDAAAKADADKQVVAVKGAAASGVSSRPASPRVASGPSADPSSGPPSSSAAAAAASSQGQGQGQGQGQDKSKGKD